MTKRVKLADVAKLSGVSTTTVSMVLNDRPNTRLSEETAQRVRAAAAQLNYRPNPAARGLRVGKTATVGFVSDEVTVTRYASAMIRGLLDVAEQRQHTVLIAESGNRPDQVAQALDAMLDRRADGIVFGLMGAKRITVPEV
ncbi:MAG: LacI family DNA-binding transcriptional regulator, partial [Propionicimonas sp.]